MDLYKFIEYYFVHNIQHNTCNITAINLMEILPMQPVKQQLKNKLICKCSTDINYEISQVVLLSTT